MIARILMAVLILGALMVPGEAFSEDKRLEISADTEEGATAPSVLIGSVLPPQAAQALIQKRLDYELRLVDFNVAMLQRTESAFGWQAIASWLMMGLSVLLVLSGIAMSAYQFIIVAAQAETRAAQAAADAAVLRSQAAATVNAAAAVAGQPPPLLSDFSGGTKLEISPTAIRVESGALGVIILVISLGFTYLFLDKVYELKPLRNEGQPQIDAPGLPGKPAQPAPK